MVSDKGEERPHFGMDGFLNKWHWGNWISTCRTIKVDKVGAIPNYVQKSAENELDAEIKDLKQEIIWRFFCTVEYIRRIYVRLPKYRK